MVAARPTNHVTKALAESRRAEALSTLPVLPRAELERLEHLHPPRCLRRDETVEDHLRYAGRVELVQALRTQFDAAHDSDKTDQEDGGGMSSERMTAVMADNMDSYDERTLTADAEWAGR